MESLDLGAEPISQFFETAVLHLQIAVYTDQDEECSSSTTDLKLYQK